MTIKLYKIKDDRKQVTKNLVDSGSGANLIATLTAHTKADTDILKPTLEIAYDSDYISANYVYIQDWNRYYFITGMNAGAQRIYISCEVDVLFTYATDIRKLRCVIARQENRYNTYLNDGKYHLKQYKTVARYVFPYKFSDRGSYVLAVGGDS